MDDAAHRKPLNAVQRTPSERLPRRCARAVLLTPRNDDPV